MYLPSITTKKLVHQAFTKPGGKAAYSTFGKIWKRDCHDITDYETMCAADVDITRCSNYQYQIKLSISFNPALILASSLLCTCLYASLRLAYPQTEPITSSTRFVSNTIHRTEIECVYLHNRKIQCHHKPFLLRIMTYRFILQSLVAIMLLEFSQHWFQNVA